MLNPPEQCPCLKCVLKRIAAMTPEQLAMSPTSPVLIKAVYANGRMDIADYSSMPSMASALLKEVPSFSSWEIAPLINGDLTKATYRATGGGFVRMIQLTLPKHKKASIPPLGCIFEVMKEIGNECENSRT